ncbi:hypothetical protein AZE42_00669 [Rhizopogon vesiculosus]|uniref:Protein kinase domain-containing protein n=1 Tax=Rhizopogon vesiculosus TaxID=180088 RepID=A0A1J8Q7C1_9AGAM|nr:hypothetical protein AZE42_00669 [Rhizopogon vesiculosus]
MVIPESGNLTFGSLQTGNTRWMPPEFLGFAEDIDEPQSPLMSTKAGDIYSFGCVMLQILTGEEPYSWIKSTPQVSYAILVGQEPFRGVDRNIDESYRLLSSRCFSRKPERRPSIIEITTIVGPVKAKFSRNIPRIVQSQSSVDDETWSHQNVRDLTGQLFNIPRFPTASGGYGDVWKCDLIKDGTVAKVAAKTIRRQGASDDDALKKALKISDVANGLRYLHSQSTVHGDLTGANVLVCAQGRAHLADFGLSIILKEHDMVSHSVTGAARWAAPELFSFSEDETPGNFLSLQSDMYSFGSIMFQILSGTIPYHKLLGNNQVIGAIIKGSKPPRPEDPQIRISDQHWDFIQECWLPIERRYSRPSANDAYDFLQYECGLIFESTILLL